MRPFTLTLVFCFLLLGNVIQAQTVQPDYGDPRHYGAIYDGATDCSEAINRCIRNHKHVRLMGEGTALCQHSIILRSGTWLELDPTFRLKLADGVNDVLIRNEWAQQAYYMGKNLIDGQLPSFMAELYPDYGPTYPSPRYQLGEPDRQIRISGGILDGNGGKQTRQDYRYGCVGYWGILIALSNVDGFTMTDVTMSDPCTYFTNFSKMRNFHISDIRLELVEKRLNQDGIHIEGECYNGLIENIFGQTNDDMVALNGGDSWFPKNIGGEITDEAKRRWHPFIQGAIENIVVRNVFAEDGYRGFRLLSNAKIEGLSPDNETEGMKSIVIDGVYGSYLMDLFLISNHIGTPKSYADITIRNVKAISKGRNNINIEAVNIGSLVIEGMDYYPTNSTRHVMLSKGNIRNLMLRDVTLHNNHNLDLSAKSAINHSGNIGQLKLSNVISIGQTYKNICDTAQGAVGSAESIMSDYRQ